MAENRLKPYICVCASPVCHTHDCQSASSLLYRAILEGLYGKVCLLDKKIRSEMCKLETESDQWLSEMSFQMQNNKISSDKAIRKITEHKKLMSLKIKKLAPCTDDLGYIVEKLGTLRNTISYSCALKLEKKASRLEDRLNHYNKFSEICP